MPGWVRPGLAQHLGGGGGDCRRAPGGGAGDYAAPPNGIYAVFPQRKHLALRVRLWIDYLKAPLQHAGVLATASKIVAVNQ